MKLLDAACIVKGKRALEDAAYICCIALANSMSNTRLNHAQKLMRTY